MDREIATVPVFLTKGEADALIRLFEDVNIEAIVSLNKKVELMRAHNYENKYTPESLLYKIYQLTGYTKSEINSKSRKRAMVDLRASISHLLHDLFKTMTYEQIGWYIHRNHSTAMYCIKHVDECKEVRDYYLELKLKLGIE